MDFYRHCEQDGVDFLPPIKSYMWNTDLSFQRSCYGSDPLLHSLSPKHYEFRPDGFLRVHENPSLVKEVLGKDGYCYLIAHYLYHEMKQWVFQFFPHTAMLEGTEQAEFEKNLRDIALKSVLKADELAREVSWHYSDKAVLRRLYQGHTRSGKLRRIKAERKEKRVKKNPIFCITILEAHWCWNATGVNEMRIELAVRWKQGRLCREIKFSHLLDEACCINYPLYKYIQKIYDTTDAIHPKEKEIFEALMEGEVPLEPLICSYLAYHDDFLAYNTEVIIEGKEKLPEDVELKVLIIDVDDYANCEQKDVAMRQQMTLLEEAIYKSQHLFLAHWFPTLYEGVYKGVYKHLDIWVRHYAECCAWDNHNFIARGYEVQPKIENQD